MCNNTKAISFWNFLKENTIEIPIIQRDYAQGRLGKENLRKNFLADLKNALDSNETMKLDFVYGSTESNKLNPLDGQQRLTTLWLLHWYIALRAGELSEDNCKIFRKFTYETRISSREFCQNLCIPEYFKNFDGNDIVGFITKQTWFYSAWKQDPTIQSMLRMLGGTKIADKKGEDIIDGIEEFFQETYVDDFKYYWEKLTQKEVIVFYHLPLKDFGLSDDLYIKMNARGKQLTNFENFKADLIGYITKQAEDNPESGWKGLLDAEKGIPIKLDTDWTDIFWKNKSKESKIDEIYFAFINRFFLQELICAKKEDKTDLYSADNLENENVAFRHLYGEKGDDSRLQYSGLDKYLIKDSKLIPLSFFTSFRDTLNNFKPDYSGCKFFGGCCINAYLPTWVDSKFEFIPKYNDDCQISTLGQKERVAFLAVCRYFEKEEFENTSFEQWMRVVWNIAENAGINSVSSMIGVMRLIDELSIHSHDIYAFLGSDKLYIKSSAANEQVAEEITKAKQILNGAPRSDGKSWEDTIIEAENYAFFKGAIRFLFPNGEGNREKVWSDSDTKCFDTKWGNAKTYFDKNGELPNSELLKSFICYFNKWEDFKQIYYDNKLPHWKSSLLNSKLQDPLHQFLMAQKPLDFSSFQSHISDDEVKNVQNQIVKTNLLEKIPMDDYYMEDGRILHRYYKNRDKDIYIWNPQKKELLSKNHIECEKRIANDCDFFYGKNINFKYKYNDMYYFFQWYGYPSETELDVYLMEDDWKDYKKRTSPTNDKGTDEDKYYCFRFDKNQTEEGFIGKLNELINQVT